MNLNKISKTMGNVAKRIATSDNRTLGTLFGCVAGGLVGYLAIAANVESLPILGHPGIISYEILGGLAAAGLGANLSGAIGASIDTLTDKKTIFDLIKGIYHLINKKDPQPTKNKTQEEMMTVTNCASGENHAARSVVIDHGSTTSSIFSQILPETNERELIQTLLNENKAQSEEIKNLKDYINKLEARLNQVEINNNNDNNIAINDPEFRRTSRSLSS